MKCWMLCWILLIEYGYGQTLGEDLRAYNVFYDEFVCEEKNITSEVLLTPPCTIPPAPPAPPTPPVGPCPSLGSFRTFDQLPSEGCPVTSCDILSPGFCSATVAPTIRAGYIPFVFVNNSGYADTDVYVSIYNPASNGNPDRYIQFDTTTGIGTPTAYTATTYLNNYLCTGSTKYTYRLSDFASSVLYLPNDGGSAGGSASDILQSSRIFVSLINPLTYFIDHTGTLNITTATQIDDNYFVLYDKVEFDLGSNGRNRLNLNLTGVDFFGLPLEVRASYNFLSGTTFCQACATTGWPSGISFSDVFSQYQNYLTTLPDPFSTYWGSLVAKYTNPGGSQCNVRIFSPASAMSSTQTQTNPTVISFPTNYFLSGVLPDDPSCTWFNAVWQGGTVANPVAYYMQKPSPYLILDASTTTYPNSTASGSMQSNGSFYFSISGSGVSANSSVTFPKPTSSKAFFTGAVSDYTPAITGTGSGSDAGVQAQVLKVFTASIIAGFFPINSNVVGEIDSSYITSHSSSYFQNNSILESYLRYCECEQNIPWYDFYSRSLLSIGQNNRFYTSAYSDFLELDGTIVITSLVDHNSNAYVTTYINDSTTNIPNPYSDATLYTVTVLFNTGVAVSSSTSAGGPWTTVNSGVPYASLGSQMFLQVTYSAGVYSGVTVVTQVAPIQKIYHPVLPVGGSVSLSGTNVSIEIGSP